jgi:hypothetical protein
MKRLMIGLALLALGTVAHAQQSVCVSFAPGGFCDGLEVTFTPVEITPGACPFNPQREGGRAFLDSLR